MRYTYLLVLLCCFNCKNERVLQLPEIKNADVTEVFDVSPAYIFYDEAQPDSTLLNRKNIISTTNWLVNVDKRLSLQQAIPYIILLQEKKRNAEIHKNENAKNYFTCNDTSIENLGFIEFTDVYYEFSERPNKDLNFSKIFEAETTNSNKITHLDLVFNKKTINNFKNDLSTLFEQLKLMNSASFENKTTSVSIDLYFEKSLSFQDYITVKSELLKLKYENFIISTNEYIY